MIKWFKALRMCVASYQAFNRRLDEIEKMIKNQTTLATDLGHKDPNYVITIGQYRDHDYVQVHTIQTQDFNVVVNELKKLQRLGTVQRVDAPPFMSHIIKRDIQEA